MSITLDLINAIQAGDSTGIEQHFDYLMTSRIAERLDDMRVEVAKNMFKEEVEELDEALNDNDWVHIKRKGSFHDPKNDEIVAYSKSHKDPNKGPSPKNGANTAMRISDAKKRGYTLKEDIESFEDITPEDIEEFMQTEDFEQLDEISKEALRSYMDKSVQSYSDTGTKLRAKLQQGEEDPKLRKKILNRLDGQMRAYNKIKKA